MTDCHVCGTATDQNGPPYRCAYCGQFVCREHRLPEDHDCSGSRLPEGKSAQGREPKRLDMSKRRMPGTSPKDTGVSGPDVAVDGSVVGGEETDEDEETSKPWWKRLWPF